MQRCLDGNCLEANFDDFHGAQVFRGDCNQRLDAFRQLVCQLAGQLYDIHKAGAFLL